MNVKNKLKLITVFMALLVFSARASEEYESILDMSGEVLKVSSIALDSFQGYIIHKNKAGSEFELFLSEIKNYSIQVKKYKNKYLIIFNPEKFNNRPVFGGGAEYYIDSNNYKIIRKMYYE